MGGTNWTEVLHAQDFLGTSEKVYVRWLNVAASNASFVYALASIKYYDHGILLKSANGGDTWKKSDSTVDGKGVCLAVDPHDPQKLYLGSRYSGMYRSTDQGSNWQPINDGLPTTFKVFRSIAIDPADSQRIYIGVGGKVYQSADGGDSWHQLGDTLTTNSEVYRIAIAPTNPGTVYASVYDGVYKLVHIVYLPIVLKNMP